jgi:hypothetical protein
MAICSLRSSFSRLGASAGSSSFTLASFAISLASLVSMAPVMYSRQAAWLLLLAAT